MPMTQQHFDSNAGIAIGPILFVVAILAVLVGALAAGSGSFSSSTTEDANRVNATTLIQQGTSIKSGMDRLLVNGYDASSIIVSPTFSNEAAEYALFAPNGGGLTPQVPPVTVVVPGGNWDFVPQANLPGIGSSGANDFVVAVEVKSAAMCKAINGIIFGKSAPQTMTVPTASAGMAITLTAATGTDAVSPAANSFDLSVSGLADPLNGRTQACFSDGGSAPKFFYYQIISAG